MFNCYKKATKWLCENLFDKKLVMIFCTAKDGKWEAVDDKPTKKLCRYHKRFLELNAIINNDSDEKKCEEILKLYETKKETFKDALDFFYFSSKDSLFLENKNCKYS